MRVFTFYSFKGGVGRSLALINVGHWLAREGLNVLMVDMDLEAPGLGRTPATGGPGAIAGLGVSDLVLGWVDGEERAFDECLVPVLTEREGGLSLMPAGTRAEELAERLGALYADPNAPQALVFARLKEMFGQRFDVVLIDSRTGLADVAGICTVELADVLVAVCGLNEQNTAGMQEVLARVTKHDFRDVPPAVVAVLSPVPSREWAGEPPERTFRELFGSPDRALTGATPHMNPRWERLERAVRGAQTRLLPHVHHAFGKVRTGFPDLLREDLLHTLEHDPEVPLLGELLLDRPGPLARQYAALACSLAVAFLGMPRRRDPLDPLPWLLEGGSGPRDV